MAGEHDLDMVDFLFEPIAEIKVTGNQKENRTLMFEIEEIKDTENAIKEDTKWTVLKDGEEAKDSYVEGNKATDPYEKQIIFTEPGTYTVQATLTDGKTESTIEKEVVIEKDQNPVADFELEKKEYQRGKDGTAEVTVKDTSYSPDKDEIGTRIWTLYYDANHNGIYELEEGKVISDTNEKEVTYKVGKLGNYKVELKVIETFEITNLYDNHHFKIVTDKNSISVWDGEELIVDHYVLPENNYGYGFGPIISHNNHSCDQQSYFTFRNITIQTISGMTLADIIDNYKWREESTHYVIHLSENQVPELSSDKEKGILAKALLENEVSFIGIGNETNKDQYLGLLDAGQLPGMFLPSEELTDAMAQVKEEIEKTIANKDYTVKDYISVYDKLIYKPSYTDRENDPIYEQKWVYKNDPSIFGEVVEGDTPIITTVEEPILMFDRTGSYSVQLKVRDNPVGENDAFDSYRQWSEEEGYNAIFIVQTRPVAIVTAEVTEGKLPEKLAIGSTYLVKYVVKDIEGTYSKPAITVVTAAQLEK